MKVSLYLRDELWEKFKRGILRRTGEIRTLSSEVQSLIQDSLVEDAVLSGFERMRIECKPLNFMRVVAVKPSAATSSGAALKEMRESRHGKAVSR